MSGLASLFPPPPPYYKRFTAENVAEVERLQRDSEDVPRALAELVPPPPPSGETYRNFGSIWPVNEHLPSLKEFGIEQLYADGVEQSTAALGVELKRLLHSVLVNYLGLVQTLGADPTRFPERVTSLRTLLINMHHLLNTYRPLQTRESLVVMMEDQIRATRESAARTRELNAAIGARIDGLAARLPPLDSEPPAAPLSSIWDGYDLDIDVKPADPADDEDAIME